jgi:hypothetical protein
MTTVATRDVVARAPARALSYRHAHWYFLAVLSVTIAGFWSSFFSRLGATDFWHSLHGSTATLWVVALAAQSWLMSRGRVLWHRRVARAALLLILPMLVISALYMVGVAQRNAQIPPFARPFLAFIDLLSVVFLVGLVVLALRNVKNPEAHKRFMSATVLLGLPAALTRLYVRVLFPQLHPLDGFYASLITVELVLAALIIADWRAREGRLAYPLSLAFFLAVHALVGPVSATGAWRAAMAWYGSLPVFF